MSNLRTFRLMHDKTQKEIAKMLGITHQAYSLLEKGINTLDVDKAIILCNYYDVTIQQLMGRVAPRKTLQEERELQQRQALVILKHVYGLGRQDMRFVRKFVTMDPLARKSVIFREKRAEGMK